MHIIALKFEVKEIEFKAGPFSINHFLSNFRYDMIG